MYNESLYSMRAHVCKHACMRHPNTALHACANMQACVDVGKDVASPLRSKQREPKREQCFTSQKANKRDSMVCSGKAGSQNCCQTPRTAQANNHIYIYIYICVYIYIYTYYYLY